MIKPRELKENNLYKIKGTENIYKCIGHFYDHGQKYVDLIETDEEDFNMPESTHINDIEPIPLTEEILLKCGFNFWGGITSYCDREDFWSIKMEDGRFEIEYVELEIKHLHQLQNLYFALTGKELEIEL